MRQVLTGRLPPWKTRRRPCAPAAVGGEGEGLTGHSVKLPATKPQHQPPRRPPGRDVWDGGRFSHAGTTPLPSSLAGQLPLKVNGDPQVRARTLLPQSL